MMQRFFRWLGGCDTCDTYEGEAPETITRFEVARSDDGLWRWTLVSANGYAVGGCIDGFATRLLATRAAKRLPRIAAVAAMVVVER